MARHDKSFIKNERPISKRPPSKYFGALDIETVRSEQQIPGTTALGGEIAILTFAYEYPLETGRYKKSDKARKDKKKERVIIDGHLKDWSEFFKMVEVNPFLRKVIWYAHNMEFDISRATKVLIEYIEQGYIIKPIINGLGRFICVKIYDTEGELFFTLRDSAAVIAGTLDSITSQLSPECKKLVGAINWESEQFSINNPLHVEYAMQDSRALLASIIKLEEMLIKNFGVAMRLTAASISMQSFRVILEPGQFYKRENALMRDYQRQAYYGGYVFCGYQTGKTVEGPLFHYDFSSCYPFCMRAFGVPSGHSSETFSYRKGDIGIYRVRVTIEDYHLPVIPLRTKKGIIWPRGTFETTVCSVDLNNADKQGIKYQVLEGIRFKSMCFPFKKIVDKCEKLRKEFKGSPIEMLAKLIQNSLYGKFASREELTETIYAKELDAEYDCLSFGDFDTDEGDTGLERYKQTKDNKLDEDYLIIAWSVFITAHARSHLHDKILIAGIENTHYTDTDSLVVNETGKARLETAGFIKEKLNAEYGDLVHENTYNRFKAIAPKVYVAETETGKVQGKAKGIPKKIRTEDLFRSILDDHETATKTNHTFESVGSFKSVLKGGAYSNMRTRKLTSFKNSAGWVDESGKVLTAHIDNIKQIIGYTTL